MKKLSFFEIANAVGGSLSGGDGFITNVSTDSRNIAESCLFIPLKGENFDGHEFIAQVFENGAALCLSERDLDSTHPYIKVKSTTQAIKDLAEYYRKLFDVKVVGITGSVGKTTTKEMIACVLSEKYNVLKTKGNFNNEIGLPLTVFNLDESYDMLILEMGMNHFGEIKNLSKIARPDIAVITNIGVSHIENLGSREGILKAKSEIFEYMEKGSYAFINGDDDMLKTARNDKVNISFFGQTNVNGCFCTEVQNKGLNGTDCKIYVADRVLDAHIPSPGEHMVYNALAAAAVGEALGLTDTEIISGLKNYTPQDRRQRIINLENIDVIDDCYNASPTSVMAAIDVLCYAGGRKVAILGDMLELGKNSAEFHRQVGVYAAEQNIDLIITVGPLSKNTYKGAVQSAKTSEVLWFESQDEMLSNLKSHLKASDAVLVKASRGMHFEQTVEFLTKNYGG